MSVTKEKQDAPIKGSQLTWRSANFSMTLTKSDFPVLNFLFILKGLLKTAQVPSVL
jgi:hypothetical protein